MKKVMRILSVLFLLAVLVSCGKGNERVLDYRSIRDTELNAVISLGDSRREAERVLGRPFADTYGSLGELVFTNGMVVIFENDIVIRIIAANIVGVERFEILNYSAGMTKEQINAGFIFAGEIEDDFLYVKFYDNNGNSLNVETPPNQGVGNSVTWRENAEGKRIVLMVYDVSK